LFMLQALWFNTAIEHLRHLAGFPSRRRPTAGRGCVCRWRFFRSFCSTAPLPCAR
jgi:hypothetical protein